MGVESHKLGGLIRVGKRLEDTESADVAILERDEHVPINAYTATAAQTLNLTTARMTRLQPLASYSCRSCSSGSSRASPGHRVSDVASQPLVTLYIFSSQLPVLWSSEVTLSSAGLPNMNQSHPLMHSRDVYSTHDPYMGVIGVV